MGSWALASNRIDFSQNRFEEVSLKIPQGFFSKKLVGKNRFKMIFKKCLPCFNHLKKNIEKSEVFKEPRIFQETVSKKFF